ncbi:MAG: phosphotransferase [Mariniblastus sp.]|nr:phosphotransferase [Mariniblastus sp.]
MRITQLENAGGFSGARITLIEGDTGKYCLRQWPTPHPTQQRLDWIHRNLLHAGVNGCPVPVPIRTSQGDTFSKHNGHLWELSPWMPGSADFEKAPNSKRLLNAVQKLAEFHQSTAQVQLDFGPSKNMISRVEQLTRFPAEMQSMEDQALQYPSRWIASLYGQLRNCAELAQPCLYELSQIATQPMVLQPVIRDIWHDHILFTGNEVSGIVDFGAMQMDNVALDLARMLGSLVGDVNDPAGLRALEHYGSFRPLQDTERQSMQWLDRSAVLLGSLNWLRWIVLEERNYDDWQAVQRRVEILSRRLEQMSHE